MLRRGNATLAMAFVCNVLFVVSLHLMYGIKSRARSWRKVGVVSGACIHHKQFTFQIQTMRMCRDICILNDWSVKYIDIFITIASLSRARAVAFAQRIPHLLLPIFECSYFRMEFPRCSRRTDSLCIARMRGHINCQFFNILQM